MLLEIDVHTFTRVVRDVMPSFASLPPRDAGEMTILSHFLSDSFFAAEDNCHTISE
jgi:hypothetical protein